MFEAGGYRPGSDAKPRALQAAHAVVESKLQLACEVVYALDALRVGKVISAGIGVSP